MVINVHTQKEAGRGELLSNEEVAELQENYKLKNTVFETNMPPEYHENHPFKNKEYKILPSNSSNITLSSNIIDNVVWLSSTKPHTRPTGREHKSDSLLPPQKPNTFLLHPQRSQPVRLPRHLRTPPTPLTYAWLHLHTSSCCAQHTEQTGLDPSCQ